MAAVDAAFTEARSTGVTPEHPEWARIETVYDAIHNLWNTLKTAAGSYWAELSTDARVRGLLTTLTTRAVRAIANLATTAATHLEHLSTPQQAIAEQPREPSLRDAYIKARAQIRGHAATHDWQRITALWGTVNTLARHTTDPGIRAVTARIADAISDHTHALSLKLGHHQQPEAAEALAALAAAAEQHATTLRSNTTSPPSAAAPRQTPTATNPDTLESAGHVSTAQPATDPSLLQLKARQVAHHAQARLRQPSRKPAAGPSHRHGAPSTPRQSSPTRPPIPPAPQHPGANVQVL